jgi:hyperosmotically inducible protein
MQRPQYRAAWLMLWSASVLYVPASAMAQTAPPASATTAPSSTPDNTKINERDRSSQATTPTSQPNDKADIKLAAAVRRAVVKDDTLSMSAHNIKIVAAHGAVTLRGPVKSADEKARVESIVKSVAGVNSLDNELDIKP